MANIKRLRNGNSLENFIYDLLEMARNGEMDNITIAFKHKDGTVLTGWYGLDAIERQTLASHQQMDIVKHMIDENYVWGE